MAGKIKNVLNGKCGRLESHRLVLRHINGDDLDNVIALTRKYKDIDSRFPLSLMTVLIEKKYFEPAESPDEDPDVCLLITTKQGRILGSIAFYRGLRYVEGFELAYHIFCPSDRGNGYMSEAISMLLDYLFQVKKAPRIQVNVESDNIAGQKVVKKHGFVYEGTMRKAVRSSENFQDLDLFSLLLDEWKLHTGNFAEED